MSDDQPSYPEDAAVGEEEARAAEARRTGREKKKQMATGAALGIGSAAIVAALLYANRGRKADKKD